MFKGTVTNKTNRKSSFTFSVKSANNTNLTNGALNLCLNLPDEKTAKNLSIHSIEDPMSTPSTTSLTTSRKNLSIHSIEDPMSTPSTTSLTTSRKNLSIHSIEDPMSTPSTTSLTTSRASNLFAMSYILMVFYFWFFLDRFANVLENISDMLK